MLELGVRLAFNKPTIIIKDEQTKYIFDIGLIRTLEYDSAFMYEKVIKFHENLKNTINEIMNGNTISLMHLVEFNKLNETEIKDEDYKKIFYNSINEITITLNSLTEKTERILKNTNNPRNIETFHHMETELGFLENNFIKNESKSNAYLRHRVPIVVEILESLDVELELKKEVLERAKKLYEAIEKTKS